VCNGGRDGPTKPVSAEQGPAQHSERTEVSRNGPGEEVVTEIQVHETREVRERRRERAGDAVVGEVEHREAVEPADVRRDAAGDAVSDEVDDAEERQGCDAARDLAGDSLPVCDGDAGKSPEPADRRRDVAGHVAGPVSSLEDRLLGLAAEVDVGDAAGLLVAAHAVPVVAAVGTGPRVEDSEVGFVERRLECEQRGSVGRRTRPHAGDECHE